jgi:hypothetical protein
MNFFVRLSGFTTFRYRLGSLDPESSAFELNPVLELKIGGEIISVNVLLKAQ